MQIVDRTQDWAALGHGGQQSECCDSNGERVDTGWRTQCQRSGHGSTLALRQRRHEFENAGEQLGKTREREFRLCCHTSGAQDDEIVRQLDGRPPQCRLSDAGLASDRERPTSAVAGVVEQLFDARNFYVSPYEHRPS